MGKVIMSGIVPQMKAPGGILASDLAVGSVVKLIENGVATEYLVVNQGIPGNSNLYDSSCNGTWLLRNGIHSNRAWGNSITDDVYKTSAVNTWLNGEFFNSLGTTERSVIRQVKIPFVNGKGGSAIASGTNGLSVKTFLLGGCEVGLSGLTNIPSDGIKLNYFEAGTGTSANNKRIASLGGSAALWWLRSVSKDGSNSAFAISKGGTYSNNNLLSTYGVRPAIILPFNALFDGTTLILKGVA